MPTTLHAYLALLRPLNVVLFFGAVALGGVLAGGAEAFEGAALGRVLLAMASGAAIGGAANAINDVFDLRIDRRNRPGRPLPSGAVPVRAAQRVWSAGTALGVGLGLAVSPWHGVLAVGTAGVLYAYSARLKRLPLVGNLVVAGVLAEAVVYGALAAVPAVERLGGAVWLGATLLALTTLAREVAKDVEDMPGDAAEGARTLPLVWGVRAGVTVAGAAVAGALALAAWAPGTALGFAFLPLVLPACGLLVVGLWRLMAEGDRVRHAAAASARFKLAMVAGALALAGARLAAVAL